MRVFTTVCITIPICVFYMMTMQEQLLLTAVLTSFFQFWFVETTLTMSNQETVAKLHGAANEAMSKMLMDICSTLIMEMEKAEVMKG